MSSLKNTCHCLVIVGCFALTSHLFAADRFVDAMNCPGPGDGSVGNPFCVIQDCIDAANEGDECIVHPGSYSDEVNFSGKAITVRSSSGAAVTTIDGANAPTFGVLCRQNEGPDSVLSGFTISNKGMWNEESSPTITDCIFFDNGTGIYNGAADPTIRNCMFKENGNSGTGGGGIFNGDASPLIINCKFIKNEVHHFGGAIYNGGGAPTIVNCLFAGNDAIDGAGIYNIGSSPEIINCTFDGNTGSGSGTAIWSAAGSFPILHNCIIRGETFAVVHDLPTTNKSLTTIYHSNVQGGWPGDGNFDTDPVFLYANGFDDDPDTYEDNDYRLAQGSPCIDAGDNTIVPKGVIIDLDMNSRFLDDPETLDTGIGVAPIVDLGAYEFCPSIPFGDIDQNTAVNFADIQCEVLAFQGDYETCGFEFENYDVEPCGGNAVINFADIQFVVMAFRLTPPCPDVQFCD